MNFKNLTLVLLLIFVVNCKEKPTSFDWGLVKDNVYKNKFFGFTLPIPEGWDYNDEYSIYWVEETNAPTKEIFKNAYESKQTVTTEPGSVKNSPIFLLLMPNGQEGFQPNIYFNVENAAQIEGVEIKNIEDYLDYSLNDAKKNSSLKLDADEFTKVTIGGRPFFKIAGTFTTENKDNIYQQYYLTLNNGFGFVVVLSATSKEEMNKLENTLNTIDF